MYFIWKFVYVYHNLDVEHYAFDITEDWAKKWTRLRKTRNKRLWNKILYEDKHCWAFYKWPLLFNVSCRNLMVVYMCMHPLVIHLYTIEYLNQ